MKFGWLSKKGSTIFLPRKTFLSLGRADCCFDDPCSKCLTTGHFFSAHCPKMKRKSQFFFLIYFPQIVPMDWWNAISTIVTKIILREGREMFNHCPKMIRNSNFFKTINFSPTCSSAHVECNFDNPWNSYGNRPKKIVQLPNMLEEVQNFWKFFPKIVLMDRWNEWTWTNPVKNLPQKAEKLTLTVRKWKRKSRVMRSFVPQRCSYSHVKGSFVNPVGTSSPQGRIFYGRRPIKT